MRWISVAICLAAVIAPAHIARADSTPAEHHDYSFRQESVDSPPCIDHTPVVGRSRCRRFASWALAPDLPRVQVTIGASVRVLGDHGLVVGEAVRPRIAYARSAAVGEVGGASGEATTFDYRVTWDIAHFLYTGVEVNVGSVTIEDPRQERALGIQLGEDSGMYYSAAGVVGAMLIGGPLVLRGEILGGARFIEIPIEPETSGRPTRTSATQAVVSPQVAAEVWLSPWVTLGGRAGSDLVRRDDYLIGLYLAFYGRAYNGSRSRPLTD